MGRSYDIQRVSNFSQGPGEKTVKPERTILQIVAAHEWHAVYAVRPEGNNNNPVWVSPLACWALVQQGKNRYVVGLDCTLSFCDQGDNFLGYLAPGEKSSCWEEEAVRNFQQSGGK